jgi:tetratricopeptide (TPR) repeat protein
MTDHRIRRRPLTGDQTGMIAERHDRLSGLVKLLYPPSLPDTPSTRLYRAMAQGDAELLRRSVAEAKPVQAEPYFALGEAFKKAGRTEEALGAFRAAAERSPGEPAAFVAAAELMMARGESAGAIALLEPALKRTPRDVQLLNSLAILYVDRMRLREAAALLATAVEVNPEDPLSWLNLGVSREASGDRPGAIAAYRTSLAIQPDLPRARQFLDRISRSPR